MRNVTSGRATGVGGLAGLGMGVCLCCASTALATDLKVIYSEIITSPTSIVPGALDAAGQPVVTTWNTLASPGLAVRITGDDWVVRGTTTQATSLDNILIKGSGLSGTMFLQEGQPVQGGGAPGETYAFFDNPPVHFNASGNLAYSARAQGGGSTADDEKLATFDGVSHTIVLQQGSSVLGLQNGPSGSCTNPVAGNSIGSVTMLDSGVVAWGNTPITGCHSSLYPALFHGDTAIMQRGITQVLVNNLGEEIITNFSFSGAAFSPDGSEYLIGATTNNPNAAADRILLMNQTAVMREGQPVVAGETMLFTDVFNTWYAPNGDWYARGDDPSDDDWAVRNGVLLAKTGLPIVTGETETWGNAISSFFGNSNGDYVIAGNTSLSTHVIVLNGEEVLVREGDPVDLDGNGKFDDDVFIRTVFANTVFITDNNILYFFCTLRDAVGTNLGDAFLRADLNPINDCPADIAPRGGDGQVNVTDLLAVIGAWGPCSAPCPPDINSDGQVNVTDLLTVIGAWGPCP